jgi:hypothetical protein
MAGCADDTDPARRTTSEGRPTASASPTGSATRVRPHAGQAGTIKATYETRLPGDEYVGDVEVFTRGEERTRVTYSVPGDVPPTIYRWTWDGEQVLELINESDRPYWTLYRAPSENRDIYDTVAMWMADPHSPQFARTCADAHYLNKLESIAERPAEAYRCGPTTRASALKEGTIVWLDRRTGLLLGWESPGEGEDGADTMAVAVITNVKVRRGTFSTQAPPDAQVKIVASKQ